MYIQVFISVACLFAKSLAVEKSTEKILVASYDVVESFHSHFMMSLSDFLRQHYQVTLLDHNMTSVDLLDASAPSGRRQAVTSSEGSPMSLIKQIRKETERRTSDLYSHQQLHRQIVSEGYALLIYNSMDYGMPAFCHGLNLSCVQVISSGIGGVHNPLSLELINSAPYMLSPHIQVHSPSARLLNALFYLMDHYLRIYYFYPGVERLARQVGFIQPEEHQSYWQLAANTARKTLIYTNDAVDCHVPLAHSYVRIGGALLSNTTLRNEYQKMMDGASNGAVVVAFGKGSLTLSLLPTRQLMDSFGALPYLFIWSVGEQLSALQSSTVPENVHLAASIPQNSLLAHPNCRLLVTHAGLGSTVEAIYHGRPMVVLPVGGDQRQNALRITDQLKMGEHLDVETMGSDDIAATIVNVMSNSSYRENAMIASEKLGRCEKGSANQRLLNAISEAIDSRGPPKDMTRHWAQVDTVYLFSVFIFVIIVLIIVAFSFACFLACATKVTQIIFTSY